MNSLNPTAANIISSLGIKGATVDEKLPGFVPVLNANGMLDAKFIPPASIGIAVPPLTNVAFVDPNTSVSERTGSIAAPFLNITEAVSNFAERSCVAIMLCPGSYPDSDILFRGSPSSVFLIGLGECRFMANQVVMYGLATISRVFLQNIVTDTTIRIPGDRSVFCFGNTSIGVLNVGSGGSVSLSAESRVFSTDAGSVSYLSEASNVGNTSTVAGATVEDALTRLNGRKIRVANITVGSSGFIIGSSYTDIDADSSGQFDIYDLSERERSLAAGVNKFTEHKDDIVVKTVTADTITADIVNARDFNTESIVLGGYRLAIDEYGYLVVLDGSDDPPHPPEGVILLQDTVDGTYYVLRISSGRLYIANAEVGSSSSPVYTEIHITDPDTGIEYELRVVNGRLVLSGVGSGSESWGRLPTIYAVDEATGLYHRVTVVAGDGSSEYVVGLDQAGERIPGIRIS